MSQEMPMVVLAHADVVEPVPVEVLANQVELATPTREQIDAANGFFAQQSEADLVSGLLGVWTGAQVLHGLAIDTFSQKEEPKTKPRPERL